MNRNSERGDFKVGTIVGLGILFFALVGLLAVCSDDEDVDDGHAPIVLVSHEYDERGDGSDGNTGYDGEGGRSGDYDGGDGDGDRCRNVCNNTFPLPGSGEGGQR